MKYYSSMTLADFVDANWMDLPRDLVRLLENEAERLIDQEMDIEAWHDNYDDMQRALEKMIESVNCAVDSYVTAQISPSDLVSELRSICNDAEYAL